MNGNDLLRAMGHADEQYVAEAETKGLRKGLPLGWLSMAACLCILIGGALFWLQLRTGSDSTAMENAAVNDMLPEETHAEADETDLGRGYGVYVRIREWTEEGFLGTVEGESSWFAEGATVQVRFTESTNIMIYVDERTHRWEERKPTEEDFPVGTLVSVQFRKIAKDGSIVATVIDAVEEEG